MRLRTALALTLILAVGVFFPALPADAQCSVVGGVGLHQSNTSTQCFGSVATLLCPNCPGFNPRTNLIKHIDPATGSIPPFFSRLGSGAVTDNMFGIISGIDPGKDETLGTADDIRPDAPGGRCGITEGSNSPFKRVSRTLDASAALLLDSNGNTIPDPGWGLPGLNCGDLRFDPIAEGMNIPRITSALTGNSSDPGNTAKPFFSTMPSMADFCASGETDCKVSGSQQTNAHMGFDLVNTLRWAPCGISTDPNVPPPPPGCTSSTQSERIVIAITVGRTDIAAGTLDAPGTGDMQFNFTRTWTANNDGESFTPSVISWTMRIEMPPTRPAAVGGGKFFQESSDAFEYQKFKQRDPISGRDLLFPIVPYPQGPSGSGITTP